MKSCNFRMIWGWLNEHRIFVWIIPSGQQAGQFLSTSVTQVPYYMSLTDNSQLYVSWSIYAQAAWSRETGGYMEGLWHQSSLFSLRWGGGGEMRRNWHAPLTELWKMTHCSEKLHTAEIHWTYELLALLSDADALKVSNHNKEPIAVYL